MLVLVLSVIIALFVGREYGKWEVRSAIKAGIRMAHQAFPDEPDEVQWNEDFLP